jgi:hypothetical protein
LRGFGSDRFVDKNSFFASAELAPASTTGRSSASTPSSSSRRSSTSAGLRSSRELAVQRFAPVGGLGFRGVVRPQVVGFVDVGLGEQGPAVFTGLEYPF